ncbi:UNVERIFIED_CONTAM: hypothetical protein K2H54_058645 [Gekko kuhli]
MSASTPGYCCPPVTGRGRVGSVEEPTTPWFMPEASSLEKFWGRQKPDFMSACKIYPLLRRSLLSFGSPGLQLNQRPGLPSCGFQECSFVLAACSEITGVTWGHSSGESADQIN